MFPGRPPASERRIGLLSRMSIEYRLPMLIGALLLATILAVSAAAYFEVRATAIDTASRRLIEVVGQFRDLFASSTAQVRALTASHAARSAVVGFRESGDAGSRDNALAALRTDAPSDFALTELRNTNHGVLLTTGPVFGLDTISVEAELRALRAAGPAVTGAFRPGGGTLFYPIVAEVPGREDLYLLRWRRLSVTGARDLVRQLIGSNTELLLGAPGSPHWTSLDGPVPAPPLDFASSDSVQIYTGLDGERYIASIAAVPGTPFVVSIRFPLRDVLAPADRFVRRISAVSSLALLVGLLVTWASSRRLTGPLRELTHAADEITAGHAAVPLAIDRGDEIGRLGDAFTTMATEVRHSRETLEQKVEERTRDLNDTLRKLHDAQDALVRRERLAMLGQLSSGVGHELRNPLGVMTNAVYYLRTVLAAAPPNVHEYLDIIQEQVTLSEKIVGDLLDFARSKPPKRHPTSAREATDAQLSRLAAGSNGVTIDTDVPDTPTVLVDPVQLGQIILNLVTNAAQAVGKEGRISINARIDDGMMRYEVSDSGPGVPPENIEKIFEPLFTTKARGIGLGLAVSRTLARANGGELTVASSGSGGATFILTLPLAPERRP